MAKEVKRNSGYLVVLGVLCVGLVGVLFLLQPPYGVDAIVRGAAMLGYMSVFLATVSSAYLRELVKFFGQPFIKTHHIVSITGLVLITIHPIVAAWSWSSAKILLPQFSSLRLFLMWGGPPALYLIAISTVGVLLRRRLKRSWRWIHRLNYIAFLLATVHALLLGTDGQLLAVRVVAICMAALVVHSYGRKRGLRVGPLSKQRVRKRSVDE